MRKDDDGLEEFKKTFGLEVATSSVDELLQHELDAVVVSSPHSLHREHAVAALAAGAHVLVEKPMTVHLADAQAIQAAAELHGRVATVAHGWNYSRLATWAREVIGSGELGRITSVTGYMASCLTELFSGRSGYGVEDVGGFAVEAESATWAQAGAGGGYLYGQLSHLLGLALWLLPNEPEETFARARLLENGVDLDVQVSVAFGDGLIGSFSGPRPPAVGDASCLRSPDRRRERGARPRLRARARPGAAAGRPQPRRGAEVAARALAGGWRGHVRVQGARSPPDRRLPRRETPDQAPVDVGCARSRSWRAPGACSRPIGRSRSPRSPRRRGDVAMSDRLAGSRTHFERARKSLAGGVASNMRVSQRPVPLAVERGAGPRLWDVDGNEYLDFGLAYGPMILGHSPAAVVAAMHRQLDRGLCFGACHPLEAELAEAICGSCPPPSW